MGGLRSKFDYIAMIIATIFFLGIAIISIKYGGPALIWLVISLSWLIWRIGAFIKNRPVKYDPTVIPSRLLPK